MLSDEQIDKLTERHKAAIARIIARSSVGLLAAWDSLGSWNREDVDRYAALAAPIVAPARAATVTQSAAFYASVLDVRPPALPSAIGPDFAPERPFTAVWHALAQSRPFDEALAAGRAASEAHLARTITSTSRLTGDVVAAKAGKRVRWRRVPDGDACTFCVTASQQTYLSSQTADFGHDRCSCAAVPTAV